MSNDAKGNELPFELPAQPTERYRVRQIPGLRLWVVWDTVKDDAVDYPYGDKSKCEALADTLNAGGS
jgi:hypothetical protein